MRRNVKKPRNVFIHRALTAKLIHDDNRILAPKDPEDYPNWYSVFRVSDQPDIVKRDFWEIGELANITIAEAAATINRLWEALWEDSGAEAGAETPRPT